MLLIAWEVTTKLLCEESTSQYVNDVKVPNTFLLPHHKDFSAEEACLPGDKRA